MTNAAQAVNITVDDVVSEILAIDEQIEALRQKRTEFETDLQGFISDDVDKQLESKDYKCGTATVDTGIYKIKYVVSKRVKWNEIKLLTIYNQILASGENPSDYIKVSYDVSETAYKAWPEKIAKVFEPARIVETSKPKISFERKK